MSAVVPTPPRHHPMVVPETHRAVAAFGLPGTLLDVPGEELAPAEADRLVDWLADQRLCGPAVSALESGGLHLPASSAERLVAQHVREMAGCLLLERHLLEVTDLLTGGGVEVRVLKGSAVAHLDYADPSWRSFGDLDLLVRAEHFDQAARLLVGHGLRRPTPEPRPGFDRRFGKGATFVADSGLEVDLHRTLVMGPLGITARLTDLWDTATTFELAGTDIPALGRELRLLHACYHAVLGNQPPRLAPLRDIAEMTLFGDVDDRLLRDIADAWQGSAVLAAGIRTAWDVLAIADVTALSTWAARHRPTPQEQRVLDVYLDERRSYAATSIAAARALTSRRERVAFGTALLFPSRGYLRERRASLPAWVWRGVRRGLLGRSS